jgi:P-type Cu+ transporter
MVKLLVLISALVSPAAFSADSKITFNVDGMTCVSCASAIENEIKKHPEVSGVDISVRNKKVSVDFKDGKSVPALQIQKDIEKAGYKASLETPKKT